MLPAATNPVWILIATGVKPIHSSKLAINLLAQGNKMSYERDPSPANAKALAERTLNFCIQYEKVFADEFAKIFS